MLELSIGHLDLEVLDQAQKFVDGYSGEHEEALQEALGLARASDRLCRDLGVEIPSVDEVMDRMRGVFEPKYRAGVLGAVVQDGHTTAGYDQSVFHLGRLVSGITGANLLGYSQYWSRHAFSEYQFGAVGYLRAHHFWGLFQSRNSDGTGYCTPKIGLLKQSNGPGESAGRNFRELVRSQWGFRLSDDYKSSGYFIPIGESFSDPEA